MDYETFANAPITEALIDINVELPDDIEISHLSLLHERIKDRFPEKQQRVSFRADFNLSPKEPTTVIPTASKPDGLRFRSPIENKIVQARKDGFTFNKLKPYENWKIFSAEARDLWNMYKDIAKPNKVTKIGLRYINRIELPFPLQDFKEYILTIPEIAPTLPQGMAHFFMQLLIPNQKIEAMATITETMEPSSDISRFPLIFDIDVWQQKLYTDNYDRIWDEFEKLRAFKNEIFLESLTEKAKEMFR